MIVTMKKISVVVQDKDIQQMLDALADMGVLHLEHHVMPKGDELDLLREQHQQMRRVINVLSQVRPRPAQAPCQDADKIFRGVFEALNTIEQITEQIQDDDVQITRWQPWGDFDPNGILALEEQSVYVKLYRVPVGKLSDIASELTVHVLSTSEGMARIMVISRTVFDLNFDEQTLPKRGLAQLMAEKEAHLFEKKKQEQFIVDAAQYLDAIVQQWKRLEERVVYQEALAGRAVAESFSVVTGYCPADCVAALEQTAGQRQWAYVVSDPGEGDHPPTLLRNPKWVDMIKPVLGMINVLPGYQEHDISVVFLLFFSLFFGILIGDAGYGVVFACLTGAAHWKIGGKLQDKTMIYLMYLLSGMTVVWGILTGTFFGQTLFSGIKPLVPWLSDYNNVQRLCFFIGAVHLSIAHIWRGILKWPSLSMFSEMGWLCLLWGMFFMARVLVLGDPLADGAHYLFIIGPLLVAFFTQPNINPLKALCGGLGGLVLNIVNTFTDIVSYIRLFAVGLATVAVADAFNVMALDLGFSHIAAGFLAAVILVLGHAFNMILGAMAILVHGLRLNVLEFSSHMNLEWAGVKYEPFKKEKHQLTVNN